MKKTSLIKNNFLLNRLKKEDGACVLHGGCATIFMIILFIGFIFELIQGLVTGEWDGFAFCAGLLILNLLINIKYILSIIRRRREANDWEDISINETNYDSNSKETIIDLTTNEFNDKGLSLMENGKYEEAIKYFDELIKLNPYDADSWYKKSIVLDKIGKYDEEYKCYLIAKKLNPKKYN